jgi:hypothetical protein
MTITAKTARINAQVITLTSSALRPATIGAVVADLLEQLNAATWPANGEPIGAVTGGGHGDPTSSTARSADYRRVSAYLNEIDRHLAATIAGLAFLSRVQPSTMRSEDNKVRCGERTPDHIRRDPWYSGDVAGCFELAEEWTRADGTTSVRTSGLCCKHRKAWDEMQRNKNVAA